MFQDENIENEIEDALTLKWELRQGTPDSDQTQPIIFPRSVHFEQGAPPQIATLRAGQIPLVISSMTITSLSPLRVTKDGKELSFPIEIAPFDSLSILISSDHKDSLYAVGRIQLNAMPCPLPVIYTSSGKS